MAKFSVMLMLTLCLIFQPLQATELKTVQEKLTILKTQLTMLQTKLGDLKDKLIGLKEKVVSLQKWSDDKALNDHINFVLGYLDKHPEIKDFKMALGAGSWDGDFKRYQEYNFQVNDSLNNFTRSKIFKKEEYFQYPIIIVLDFNTDKFINFLNRIKGRLSEIIIEMPSTANWKKKHLMAFYNALQPKGVIYLEQSFGVDEKEIEWTKEVKGGQTVFNFKLKLEDEKYYCGGLDYYQQGKFSGKAYNEFAFFNTALFKSYPYNMIEDSYKKALVTQFYDHNAGLLQKAGFKAVKLHRDSEYPLPKKGNKTIKCSFIEATK